MSKNDCGFEVRPGPCVVTWAGSRENQVELYLPRELACQRAVELVGAALDAGLEPEMFRKVLSTLDDLAAVAGIPKRKQDERQNERGAHAH